VAVSQFDIVEREKILTLAQETLWSKPGESGRKYLLETRKIKENTAKRFKLGYVPSNVGHQLANRVIFPIFDSSDNLIALSSRQIDNSKSDLPVYWHERFNKSFYLYGSNVAKQRIREVGFAVICVEGNQDILDPTTGKMRKFKDLKKGDYVLSYNEKQHVNTPCKVLNSTFSGKKECLKIYFDNDNFIIVTGNHKVYVNGEWIEADKITEGDLLLSPLKIENSVINHSLTPEIARFLGYMIGDGDCHGSPTFTNTNKQIVTDVNYIVKEHIGNRFEKIDNRHYKIYGNQKRGGYKNVIGEGKSESQLILVKYGLSNKRSYNKEIPGEIFNSSVEIKSNFLNGLYDTDGTVSNQGNLISYSTTSQNLSTQLKTLLLYLGVKSSICVIKYKNPKHRTGYVINVSGENAKRLASYLNLKNPKKNKRIKKILQGKCNSPKISPIVRYIRLLCDKISVPYKHLLEKTKICLTTLNRKYISKYHLSRINDILNDNFLKELESGNVYASVVESVEHIGCLDVYDIKVEHFNNFYINDILVHNCEGNFDVVKCHDEGLTNVVGLLGSSVSEIQLSILLRYCENIIFIFDNDNAGEKATERTRKMLNGYGYKINSENDYVNNLSLMNFSFVYLEGAKDPDEFIQKFGIIKLKKNIKKELDKIRNAN